VIIDCHGHYTTAPAAHNAWREAQKHAFKAGTAPPPYPDISDEDIRETIEQNQLRLLRERGADLTIFSPRASAMEHHVGDVAVAQGSVKEKRTDDGKDTSGQLVWMDLLKKRNGKWAVVRSAGTRLTSGDSAQTLSQDPAIVETMKQFAQDTGDAMVAGDTDKLNQIYADDWATIGSSGKIFTKEGLLSDFKSGKHKLLSFELGPMDVQVFGDVAIVQASVTEKRIHDGKDISGQFVFMDLLKKRDGKWVIVRTLGAKVI